MTKRCILDGSKLKDLDAIYDSLAAQLGFPADFGRNLDALWDVLTRDVAGPIEIEWRDADASRTALGGDYMRIERLLREAEAARNDLRLKLT